MIKKELEELDNKPSTVKVQQPDEAELNAIYERGEVPRIKYGDVALLHFLKNEVCVLTVEYKHLQTI